MEALPLVRHNKKHQKKQQQQHMAQAQAYKENSSFTTTTDTQSRKASIGVTVAFSNRKRLNFDHSPSPFNPNFNHNHENINAEIPRSNPEEVTTLNVQQQVRCGGRNTWTPLNPFQDVTEVFSKKRAAAQYQKQDIASPEAKAVQSTRIVEEVYANRKSVHGCHVDEAAFAGRRERNFVKYERRKNKMEEEQVVRQFSIQRMQQVKFNLELPRSESHHSSPRHKRIESGNDKDSEISLRTKLRNVLVSVNEKQPPFLREKSDTIETDSQEPKQNPNSKQKQKQGAATAKRKTSPGVTHIFSFDQDESLQEVKPLSSEFKRKLQPQLPRTNTRGLKALLQTFPKKLTEESPANTVVDDDKTHDNNNHSASTEMDAPSAAKTTSAANNESPLASPNGDKLAVEEKASVLAEKEELQLFIERDAAIRRSSLRARRNTVIEAEACRQRQLKRKARELNSFSEKCMVNTEEGSDDSSDLLGVVKQFTGILQKFKQKLKMEVHRKATHILNGASHTIQKEVDRIQTQIESDIVKYTNLCKTKYRQWEANLQDENEKLRKIHENFKKDLAQHSLCCQNTFSQIEGEEIELKSIAERQKVSHKKLVSQIEELMESEVADAEERITAVRKAAANNMHALKRVMGETF